MNDDMKNIYSGTLDYKLIDLLAYARILWSAKWKIFAFTLLAGLVTLGYMMMIPNVYRATAVIKPEVPDDRRTSSALGALASVGIPIGGASRSEDLEMRLKSDDLSIQVFRKHDIWPILYPDSYNPKTGMLKTGGWVARLLGREEEVKLSEWSAIGTGRARLKIGLDKRTGALSITFDSPSPEGSERILQYYLDEAKTRIQEETLNRANINKEFIQTQIAKTFDPLLRDRLYALYGVEVEKEMLAKNREQFGFAIIDSPKAPKNAIKPNRIRSLKISVFLSFLAGCAFFIIRSTKRKAEETS